MYSYERLENLFGLDIHNAEELRDDWQHLDPGDRVVVVPPGRLGMPDGYSFPVVEVEPPHHLVLRQAPPEHPWNAVWTFVVEPEGQWRAAAYRQPQPSPAPGGVPPVGRASVTTLVMEPVIVAMTRRMLLGIRERAERSTGALGPDGPPAARGPSGRARAPWGPMTAG